MSFLLVWLTLAIHHPPAESVERPVLNMKRLHRTTATLRVEDPSKVVCVYPREEAN